MGALILTTAATACVSALVAALVGSLVAAAKTRNKVAVDSAKAVQDGIKLLLCDKARYLTDCAVEAGEITIRQRATIHEMVSVAHMLGANGEMTECDKTIAALPVAKDNN